MAKELTDDELNLRRKARRRLIGASALTLAVVVILPMVLDSEPKPGQDIDLRIPNPDRAGQFVPGVAVSEVAEALPQSAVVPVSAVVAASAPVAASAVPAASVAEPDAKPLVNETAPAKSNGAQAAKADEAKAVGKKTGYAAQVGAYSNAATAKQELDKLKKWGFKAYTEKAGDKIRVRVGPYSERSKAEKVAKLLEKHGLHPSIVSAK